MFGLLIAIGFGIYLALYLLYALISLLIPERPRRRKQTLRVPEKRKRAPVGEYDDREEYTDPEFEAAAERFRAARRERFKGG